MKIKDAEQLTGILAKTIRYYEDQRLISVKRSLNTYREYNEENINELRRIKILCTVLLTLIWSKFLKQKNKKVKGTAAMVLGILLTIIFNIAFEDTYLELEIFDNLIMDTDKAQKI